MTLAIAGAAVAAAVVAAAWPYVSKLIIRASLSPSDRAGWVNRLFILVGVAEEAGEPQVAEAARQLIATLVHPQPVSKRVK